MNSDLAKSLRPQLLLFLCAAACMAAAMGMHESVFNNFLDDTFAIRAVARGSLEFPRELPGFLVVLTSAVLCMLPVARIGMTGALIFALGMCGLAAIGDAWWSMIAMMMLGSVGMHLLQPVGGTLAVGLSAPNKRGWTLGLMGTVNTVGLLIGSGIVWVFFKGENPSYPHTFLITAGLGLLAAVFFWRMHVPHLHQRRAPLVFKTRYRLYYVLEFFFGARKQIFITFGPWVLIQVYGRNASDIAGLFFIAAVIGLGFKPLVGLAVDRFGERNTMMIDGAVLALVCLGYGYAGWMTPDMEKARWIASGCFVLDNLLFALGSSRTVYVSRLADSPNEMTGTLAMGISINHLVSMTIPFFAGAAWVAFGYERVFLGAAVLAVCISLVSSRVPRHETHAVMD